MFNPRADKNADPVAWNKAWEQFLEEAYGPNSRSQLVTLSSTEEDWLLGQGLVVTTQREMKYLQAVQLDLEQLVDMKRKTDHFDSKWLAMSTQTREAHILKTLVWTCGSAFDIENRRIYCPEMTIKHLERDGGKGLLNLLTTICPKKTKVEPRARPILVSHSIYESQLRVRLPDRPGSNDGAREALRRSSTISRNLFLSQFLYNIMIEVYGYARPQYRYVKPVLKSSDAQNVLRAAAPDAFKAWKDVHKSVRKDAGRACESCGKIASELPEGKVFMQCPKCRAIGRKVVYCDKECQLNDWKNGIPPHKQICGKLLRIPDSIEPTPVASQTDVTEDDNWLPPAAPGFVRSPALLQHLYYLHMDPTIAYILRQPPPTKTGFVSLERDDTLPIKIFDVCKARAITSGDPKAVGMMAVLLEELKPRIPISSILSQLSEEYGIDVDTIRNISSSDETQDALLQALKDVADSESRGSR